MKKILKFLYYITPSLIISASILVGAVLICKSIEEYVKLFL